LRLNAPVSILLVIPPVLTGILSLLCNLFTIIIYLLS
jgi:hypothetical protein